MKKIITIVIVLITCSACFNQNSKLENAENVDTQGFCGTIDDSKTEIAVPGIFKSKCATCHSFYKNATGPKMSGLSHRVPYENWIEEFITNQDSLIRIQDTYTLEIMQWSPVKFPHNYSDLSDDDLTILLDYIRQ